MKLPLVKYLTFCPTALLSVKLRVSEPIHKSASEFKPRVLTSPFDFNTNHCPEGLLPISLVLESKSFTISPKKLYTLPRFFKAIQFDVLLAKWSITYSGAPLLGKLEILLSQLDNDIFFESEPISIHPQSKKDPSGHKLGSLLIHQLKLFQSICCMLLIMWIISHKR